MGEWSPKTPECYSLTITLTDEDGKKAGSYDQTFALKDFRTADKQFILNGNPIHFRGGTIVWHRWMRDSEGLELGWDSGWIEENIIKRLKDHGANYLRFHLGVPPERLLDLCDKYGLAVQYEWNFFHGMPASYESLMEQYPKWFDMAARHPSVMLYHPDTPGLIMHSDQGWHYQHPMYQRVLKEHGIVQSMSRKGTCLDNAIMENFFGIMKTELLYSQEWDTIEQFERALRAYIKYYNNERIKLRLNGMSPVQYRAQHQIKI